MSSRRIIHGQKKYLVTGAAGFIEFHTIQKLRVRDYLT